MKNSIKITLLSALLLVAGINAKADLGNVLRTSANNLKSVVFFVDEKEQIDVVIYNQEEEVLHEETIKTKAAIKRVYNLEALSDGMYTMVLTSSSKIMEYKILIDQSKALVLTPKVTVLLNPVVEKKDNLVDFKLDRLNGEKVELTVLSEKNEELYSEEFSGKNQLIKKFDVGPHAGTSLTFVVTTKNQRILRTIDLAE